MLHSVAGVDYFNILQGPSNGLELLNFFDNTLEVERTEGSAALERGDVVVMDNCGFHHARHIEPLLQNMLNRCRIELIYQPPYSPHFNTCKYCYNQIKQFLQLSQVLAMSETEVAIGEAISHITAENSAGCFRKCGYLVKTNDNQGKNMKTRKKRAWCIPPCVLNKQNGSKSTDYSPLE